MDELSFLRFDSSTVLWDLNVGEEFPVKLYIVQWQPVLLQQPVSTLIYAQFTNKMLLKQYTESIAQTIIKSSFVQEAQTLDSSTYSYVYVFESKQTDRAKLKHEAESIAAIIAATAKYEKCFEQDKLNSKAKALSTLNQLLTCAAAWEKHDHNSK